VAKAKIKALTNNCAPARGNGQVVGAVCAFRLWQPQSFSSTNARLPGLTQRLWVGRPESDWNRPVQCQWPPWRHENPAQPDRHGRSQSRTQRWCGTRELIIPRDPISRLVHCGGSSIANSTWLPWFRRGHPESRSKIAAPQGSRGCTNAIPDPHIRS